MTSNDVEVVSNALLASVHLGHSTHCLEYAAWLLSKRNEEGEFLLSKVKPVRFRNISSMGEWSSRDEREVHGFRLPLYYRANTSSSIASYQCSAERHVHSIIYVV